MMALVEVQPSAKVAFLCNLSLQRFYCIYLLKIQLYQDSDYSSHMLYVMECVHKYLVIKVKMKLMNHNLKE